MTGTGTGDYVYRQGPDAAYRHAVKSIPGVGNFDHDLNGNLTSGAGRAATWFSFDMPQSRSKDGLTTWFVYGPEHQRTRQLRRKGSTEVYSVVYAGAQEVERDAANRVTVKTYWPGGIGVDIDRPGAPTELSWTHADRLGSPVALTDQNGNVREKLAYDVWRKRRTTDGKPAPGGNSATPDSLDG